MASFMILKTETHIKRLVIPGDRMDAYRSFWQNCTLLPLSGGWTDWERQSKLVDGFRSIGGMYRRNSFYEQWDRILEWFIRFNHENPHPEQLILPHHWTK